MDRVGPAAPALSAPGAQTPPALDRVGRDGTLALVFERRGAATVVTGCRFTVPLQVLAPVALGDPAAVVPVLNPTGGLVGGDRLSIDLRVGPGAHACVTSPAATRVYRTAGPPAVQDVRMDVAAGAVLEWVPEHTIPFPGSAFHQRLAVTLAEGARAILIDAFAAGRVARGEAWQFARLESALSVRDATGWRLLDRFALDGARSDRWRGPGVTDGHPYFGTVVVAGADDRGDAALAEAVARALERLDGLRAGAAVLARGGLVVRLLARSAPALLVGLDRVWALGRRHLLGLPELGLRCR